MDFIGGLDSDERSIVQSGLKKILQEEPSDVLPSVAVLLKGFNNILQKHPALAENVCDVIAHLGREVEFRTSVSSDGTIMPNIVPLLSQDKDPVQLQALRAIGNLCHDEDPCRQQFMDCGGCPLLRDVLIKCANSPSESVKLKMVCCGCLLNACCSNESLCKVMLDLDILTPLCGGVLSTVKDESVALMGLKALSVIIEADCCTLVDLSRSPVLPALATILQFYVAREYDDDDIIESVLDILETHCAIEAEGKDSWRTAVVESGCFALLLDLPSDFVPRVFNITILLLSSDEVLNQLFNNEKLWKVIKLHITNSSVGVMLKASAVLMIANMARNDANCKELAKDGTLDLLKKILTDFPVSEENSKLHYSVMSLLRNLSLPECNKLLLLQNGIVPKTVDVLNKTNDPTVMMKVLGCLRLLSTKNEICVYLCIENPSIDRICEICENASFDHIKIEGSRLLASMVKNSCQIDVKIKIAESRGVKWLLSLLKNEHMVVKNEGIVSLSLLTSLKLDAFHKEMACVDSNLVEYLLAVMEKCNIEVLENCLSLLVLMKKSGDMDNSFYTMELRTYLETIKSHESESIRMKVLQILENI